MTVNPANAHLIIATPTPSLTLSAAKPPAGRRALSASERLTARIAARAAQLGQTRPAPLILRGATR